MAKMKTKLMFQWSPRVNSDNSNGIKTWHDDTWPQQHDNNDDDVG